MKAIQSDLPFSNSRVDVHENDAEVVATCDIPGVEKKEDIHIEISNNNLKVSGFVKRTNEVKEENMYRSERFSGSFSRVVQLPPPVLEENVKASYKTVF